MEVSFWTKKLQKVCSSEKAMLKEFGPQMAKKLKQRVAELAAAGTLEDMRHLPAARCHELSQDRKGQLAVDLVHPPRLVFEPNHTPVPRKPDGGLAWTEVTRILVLEVVDYHD